jgi:hypothetical protein
VFTARYALSPYIKQIRFVFKGLNIPHSLTRLNWVYAQGNMYAYIFRFVRTVHFFISLNQSTNAQDRWQV